MKNLITFVCISLSIQTITVYGQTVNLGKPFSKKLGAAVVKDFIQMPIVNNEIELAKDVANDFSKVFRFGVEQDVNIDVKSLAKATKLNDGTTVYQLGIESKNALSINLTFRDFWLANGAKLYIVSPQNDQFDGAYTFLNNNSNNQLGTEIISGDQVIIELHEPQHTIQPSKLVIGTVVHGFKDLNQSIAKALGSAGACHYDVNCPIGLGWEDQRNGVAVTISGGSACSGSMVNNTNLDFKPYYLTARHCGTSPGSWVLRFRWERAANEVICAGTNSNTIDGPTSMSLNGAILRASNSNSDFTLVELNAAPDPLWSVYYNGWDNSDSENITNVHGIHHPKTDIKKISYSDTAPYHAQINFNGNPATNVWRVNKWTNGVTEGGSSGSPMFNQNKRICGVLTGGTASCNGIVGNGGYDVYGRFGVAWDTESDISMQLKHWLDPLNIGTNFIDGAYQNTTIVNLDAGVQNPINLNGKICGNIENPRLVINNAGTQNLTSIEIAYNYDGIHQYSETWNGNLSQFMIDTIDLAFPFLTDGNHTFQATIVSVNGSADQNSTNNEITSTFQIISNGNMVSLNLNLDNYSSETTWNILDNVQNVQASGGPYTNGSPALTFKTCLAEGCYVFKLNDSGNDGWTSSNYPAGSFTITDQNNQLLAEMSAADADFGSVLTKNICVQALEIVDIHLEKNVTIYPNPSKGVIQITVDKNITLTNYELFDLTGKQIETQKISGDTIHLNVSNGIYFLSIHTENNGNITKKVSIQQ